MFDKFNLEQNKIAKINVIQDLKEAFREQL